MNSASTAFVIGPRSSAFISSCLNMVFATVFQFLLEMFIIIHADSFKKELLHSTLPFGQTIIVLTWVVGLSRRPSTFRCASTLVKFSFSWRKANDFLAPLDRLAALEVGRLSGEIVVGSCLLNLLDASLHSPVVCPVVFFHRFQPLVETIRVPQIPTAWLANSIG